MSPDICTGTACGERMSTSRKMDEKSMARGATDCSAMTGFALSGNRHLPTRLREIWRSTVSVKTLKPEDLESFIGSENWYRHWLVPSIIYTDGARYVADTGGAHWLLDEIALAQKF